LRISDCGLPILKSAIRNLQSAIDGVGHLRRRQHRERVFHTLRGGPDRPDRRGEIGAGGLPVVFEQFEAVGVEAIVDEHRVVEGTVGDALVLVGLPVGGA
jgi:hypothetical protein